MSRIGKKPIEIPKGVQVQYKDGVVTVKGPKGTLSFKHHPDMTIKIEKDKIVVERPSDKKFHKALHGTTRQIIANMVEGVSKGFVKELEIVGTGYRARMEGQKLVLTVGYSNPVEVVPPEGIRFEVEGQNIIKVHGIDKQLVGEIAARIRKVRPPEPYKGKGIRYKGEHVRRKAGKAGAKVGG